MTTHHSTGNLVAKGYQFLVKSGGVSCLSQEGGARVQSCVITSANWLTTSSSWVTTVSSWVTRIFRLY